MRTNDGLGEKEPALRITAAFGKLAIQRLKRPSLLLQMLFRLNHGWCGSIGKAKGSYHMCLPGAYDRLGKVPSLETEPMLTRGEGYYGNE